MRHSCLWSTVAVLALILCFNQADGAQQEKQLYKVNEVGGAEVDEKFCGDQITALYSTLCFAGKRKRRSMFIDENEALSFLQHQTQRRHRRRRSSTDVVEECCAEGCAYEEMYEYC